MIVLSTSCLLRNFLKIAALRYQPQFDPKLNLSFDVRLNLWFDQRFNLRLDMRFKLKSYLKFFPWFDLRFNLRLNILRLDLRLNLWFNIRFDHWFNLRFDLRLDLGLDLRFDPRLDRWHWVCVVDSMLPSLNKLLILSSRCETPCKRTYPSEKMKGFKINEEITQLWFQKTRRYFARTGNLWLFTTTLIWHCM